MDSSPPESVGHLVPPDQVVNLHAGSPNTKTTGQRHVALGLNRHYATDWKVPDALRELYQNWKDAIIQTYKIELYDFVPHISATSDDITITVEVNQRPSEGSEVSLVQLGYIRFNKLQGNAEFTNFNSTLDDRCLEFGHSTKREDHYLAGGHGEGLKIAALVLCRENHPVKISTNGYRWHFAFNGQLKANFYCRLIPTRAKHESSAPSDATGCTTLSARTGKDVSVMVEKGQNGLSLQDIETWMRDTIDLHPPSGRVRTRSGDLLLEPTYRGHLYLKGFRVPEPSSDSSTFRFGYNLIQGSVDRDRQRLVNFEQVPESIHIIWESAIAKAETLVLPHYLELLRDYPSSFDAKDADRRVTEDIARKIWNVLVHESKIGDLFYCSESSQDKDYPIIHSELKKKPSPLSGLLWTVLRKYHLVREPMEELQSRFANSQEIKPPCTAFADGVSRTLRALLALDSSTRNTTVIFIRCATNVVDVAYHNDKKVLYVHEKWLHAPDSHQVLPDPAKMQPNTFIGQHLVEDLHRRAVAIIWQQTKGMQSTGRLQQVLWQSSLRLHQMPRNIHVTPTENENTVTVLFYTGHSLIFIEIFGSQVFYLVVLHGAGCTMEIKQLVYNGTHDFCDCPRQAVPLSSRTAIFHDVGEGPWTPMIAKMPDDMASAKHLLTTSLRAEEGALIGIPSQAASPSEVNAASEDIVLHTEEGEADLSTSPAARGQATELTAAMPFTEMPPVDSDRASLKALSSDAVEMLSLDRYGADDPAFAWSQAARLMESASAGSSVSSGQCEWEGQAEKNGPHACTDVVPNQGHMTSTDDISETKVETLFQPCEDSQPTWKGQYIQATLAASEGSDRRTNQCILYVHDVRTSTENTPFPQLVVTKYSFLTDHPALSTSGTASQRHELVLHFHDADRMGEIGDAQILDISNVVAVDAFIAPGTVVHVPPAPEPAAGLFARYGVRDGSRLESLFVTSLRTGRDDFPCLSPLPVASVFDLSPEDISLSAGFSQAGYRIHAALGLNESYHQLWTERYPATAVYLGSPASVIADLDSGKLSLQNPGDSQAPRIITICSRKQADASHTDPTELLPACIDGLRNCSLAAQSPTLRANFIILNQPHCILHEQYRAPLASTVSLLLEEGYSVTLRTLSTGNSNLPEDTPVLLLAAPCGTNPQWIDDVLSDHQVMSSVANDADRVARTSATGAETPCSDHGDMQDMSSNQSTQGSYAVARQIASVVSRIIGELSKENQNRARSATWAGGNMYQRSFKKPKLSLPKDFAEER